MGPTDTLLSPFTLYCLGPEWRGRISEKDAAEENLVLGSLARGRVWPLPSWEILLFISSLGCLHLFVILTLAPGGFSHWRGERETVGSFGTLPLELPEPFWLIEELWSKNKPLGPFLLCTRDVSNWTFVCEEVFRAWLIWISFCNRNRLCRAQLPRDGDSIRRAA